MAFTQSDLDKLDRAIADGALTVKYTDKEVTYRSMAELLKARDFIARKLGQGSTAAGNRILTKYNKGLSDSGC